jgi:hypothetical protein
LGTVGCSLSGVVIVFNGLANYTMVVAKSGNAIERNLNDIERNPNDIDKNLKVVKRSTDNIERN